MEQPDRWIRKNIKSNNGRKSKIDKWIETILDTVGVMEVREKRQIQIPVYVDKSIRAYDSNYMGIFERERITIPEITIVKMG